MHPQDEKVLDTEQWKIEAQAVIDDVKHHVRNFQVSSTIQSSNRAIHLNLTTLEGLQFCVRLSPQGFSIVGNKHDCTDNADFDLDYYETIYSLLDYISPQYRNSFSKHLAEKLQQLSNSHD
ncbi:GSK3-beta interaction protein-like [Copidosoma floridanum]|uniref:GSK3-beta interaction protein-like n=1 Tax=Copidosoma floridanum TaxID=29053 RepID=UPI0006C93CD8|nr:GSK3-beta interaction protein-like [Copidosoma floridanum]